MNIPDTMLLVVDPQIDFITGTLPVPGAVEAMDALALYISDNDGKYRCKVVTADRHPYDHCSFAPYGGEWPRHCVHDTAGAAVWQPLFDPLYTTAGDTVFLYKGQDRDIEEYSILKNPAATAAFRAIIEEKSIRNIDICGLAGDICVLNTIKDALKLFRHIRIRVLTRFSPSIDGGDALRELITNNDLTCDRL